MTLTGVKRRAHAAGYDDAIHGRAYRANFQLGESMRSMGLHDEYDAGWESGRKHSGNEERNEPREVWPPYRYRYPDFIDSLGIAWRWLKTHIA